MFPSLDENSHIDKDKHRRNGQSCDGSAGTAKDKSSLNQLTMNFDKMEKVLKGKAALAQKKFQDFKEKVRVEAMEMEINKMDDNKRLKQVVGGWALSHKQMQYLVTKPYVYNASAGSVLELLFLQKFWIWLSQFIPTSISPCTITVTGLLINIITSLTILYYSPDARNEVFFIANNNSYLHYITIAFTTFWVQRVFKISAKVPAWALILAALGVFLYQTLDALDGKQCYKVQNTQIEEIYDHGCDAVSTIFVMLAVACAGQLGRTPILLFALFLTSMIAFFSTHWLCHVSHQMVFGKIDVSEGQWLMIIIHLMTAYFGQKGWHMAIPGTDIELQEVLTMATIATLVAAIYRNITMILGKKTPLDELGVNIPRRTQDIWRPVVPIAILTTFAAISYSIGYFHVSPMLFIFTFGFAFAKVTIKLVMMNCCNGRMDYWDSSLTTPLLLATNTRFIALLHPKTALLCAFVYSLMDLSRYFTYGSWDLRLALDVNIFSIKHPVGHPGNRRECGGHYINGVNNDKILSKNRGQPV